MARNETLNTAQKAVLETLSLKYEGRVAYEVADGQLYVFRSPELEEFEDYQQAVIKGQKIRGVCNRELGQVIQVHPEGDEGLAKLQATYRKYPGFATKVSDAACELAGTTIELTVKGE